jgi:hypothetical protein
MNTRFLQSHEVGPFLEECQKAWICMRDEAIRNHELATTHSNDECEKSAGPLANPTSSDNSKQNGNAERTEKIDRRKRRATNLNCIRGTVARSTHDQR